MLSLMRRRIFLVALSVIMVCLTFFWCPSFAKKVSAENGDIKTGKELFDMSPKTKSDGSKHSVAFVDYDEYLPASRQFYYILAGLEENGWIEEGSIPFSINEIESGNMSTKQMYEKLEQADLGRYIEFAEDAFHYLGYEESGDVESDLRSRAGKNIDLIITFGTSAGLFVKELGLPIPMVDYSATDPVASGIIESSTEGSGNPNVWAQVEPSLPLRQLKYYHYIKPFKKLGIIVYGDETISGVPDIKLSSEQIGFELVKYNIDECSRETEEELDAYYDLVEQKFREMADEEIDAFFLTADLINDKSRLRGILNILYEKKIPVYLMDDDTYVKYGALMMISAYDNQNVGRFVADAIGKIFNGAEAGSLPCIYMSAPSIYFNYSVAKEIGYPIKFEFLSVCDKIYTEEE